MTLLFDGTDDRTERLNFSVPLTSTICYWVRLVSLLARTQRFFGAGDKWETPMFGDNAPLNSDIRDTGTPIQTTFNIALDTWYHFAFTNEDISPFTNMIYVDGLLDITGNNNNDASTGSYTAYSHACRFGNVDNANMEMEDCRIYDRVLSAAEIQTIYNCRGHDGIVLGLIDRFMMNEGVVAATSPAGRNLGENGEAATLFAQTNYQPTRLSVRKRA